MEERFQKIIRYLDGKISRDQLKSYEDIFNFSDPKAAIECVCTQVDELEVPISKEIFQELVLLCSSSGVEKQYVTDIEYLVI